MNVPCHLSISLTKYASRERFSLPCFHTLLENINFLRFPENGHDRPHTFPRPISTCSATTAANVLEMWMCMGWWGTHPPYAYNLSRAVPPPVRQIRNPVFPETQRETDTCIFYSDTSLPFRRHTATRSKGIVDTCTSLPAYIKHVFIYIYYCIF